MTDQTPEPVAMPSPDLPDTPPVPMPTITQDGPPPVDMPTWSTARPPEGFEPERTWATGRDWPDETVEQIRLAEAAAQRSVCHLPEGDLPDELAKALERRVEVNLAQYDGGDIVRVGSKDPEVRELEAPFSRRRAAGSVDHRTQEGQS